MEAKGDVFRQKLGKIYQKTLSKGISYIYAKWSQKRDLNWNNKRWTKKNRFVYVCLHKVKVLLYKATK